MPYIFMFFGMLVLALVQGRLGFLGIEYHFGAGWAWAAIVASLLFRSFLPITIGAYFGAIDVMRWDWYIGVAVAFPGLLFVLPSMVMDTLLAFRSGSSKNSANGQTPGPSIEKNPSTGTGLNLVYQPQGLKPATQQHISEAETEQKRQEADNERVRRNAALQFSRAHRVIEYSEAAAHAWDSVKVFPEPYQTQFLSTLEAEPTSDVAKLAKQIIDARQKELRPYNDDGANDALEQARTISPEAEAEFRDVLGLLEGSLTAIDILLKIESKFGPSAATLAAEERREVERKDKEAHSEAILEKQRLERGQRKNEGFLRWLLRFIAVLPILLILLLLAMFLVALYV